jgi:hypothetical protein
MAAAGAADRLGQPRSRGGRALVDRPRVGNAEAVEFGEERRRRLDALDRVGIVACRERASWAR